MQDLYFILNPQLGLIKVGIARDAKARLRGLEHACGVALELLHVVKGAAGLEKDLHDAFYPDRQMGEWFLPSPALLDLADDTGFAALERFIAERKADILAHRADRDAKAAERKAARAAVSQAERAEAQRLKEKALALKKKRKEAEARRIAKEAAIREQQETERRARVEAERAAWAARTTLTAQVIRTDVAAERRAKLATLQRERNAALLGVPVQ